MGSSVDLEKKVGQLLMVGLPSEKLEAQQKNLLSRIGIGGAVLFKHNYKDPDQVIELTNDVQKLTVDSCWNSLPCWIAVDQEGGRVQRFTEPFSKIPSAKHLGELNSPKTTFELGYVVAQELKSVGVNVNFAPVVDVPRSMDNAALGDRAFSTDIEKVASLGSAFIRGIQKGGVLGVAKHFPGHGCVDVDSHSELPVSDLGFEELEKIDLQPFKRVVRARAEGVMTAHILFPEIDKDRCATFSRKFIQDVLRKDIRHKKLVFTDDLGMAAVQNKYSIKDAAFLALEAGCDQVLLCHNFDELEDTWLYLVNAFETGALPEKRLDESLARHLDAKKRFIMPLSYANPELAKAVLSAPEFKEVIEAINGGKSIEQGPSSKATS